MGSISTYRRNAHPSHGTLLKESGLKAEVGGQVVQRTLKSSLGKVFESPETGPLQGS